MWIKYERLSNQGNKKSGYFSILAVEATDQSNKGEMPIVLRFVDDCHDIREEFCDICLLQKGISGTDIYWYLSKELIELGLGLTKCNKIGIFGEPTV